MSVICQLLYLSLRRVHYSSVESLQCQSLSQTVYPIWGSIYWHPRVPDTVQRKSHTVTAESTIVECTQRTAQQRESTQRAQILQPFHISDIIQREYHVSTAELQSMSAVHSSGTVVRYIITLSVSYPKWISFHFISYDSHSLHIKDILYTS